MVSSFAKNPSLEHFNAFDQILRYLSESYKKGIIFGGEKKIKFMEYSDSNWAEDHTDQ